MINTRAADGANKCQNYICLYEQRQFEFLLMPSFYITSYILLDWLTKRAWEDGHEIQHLGGCEYKASMDMVTHIYIYSVHITHTHTAWVDTQAGRTKTSAPPCGSPHAEKHTVYNDEDRVESPAYEGRNFQLIENWKHALIRL